MEPRNPIIRTRDGNLVMPDNERAWRELAFLLWNRDQLTEMYRQQDEERRSREQNNDANEENSDEDDLNEVQSLQAYLFLAFLPTILMYIGLRLTANTEFYQNNHNIMQLFGMILCYINLFLASVIIFLDVLQ